MYVYRAFVCWLALFGGDYFDMFDLSFVFLISILTDTDIILHYFSHCRFILGKNVLSLIDQKMY